MEQFDIVGALKAKAISNGWKFVTAFDEPNRNYSIQEDYSNGELVLTCDYSYDFDHSGVLAKDINYPVTLILARKFDADGQAADLDETHEQKYERRLKELATLMANFVMQFKCENELDMGRVPMSPVINQYDTNLDGIQATITFIQD